VNRSNSSITNTPLEKIEEKTTEKVLQVARDKNVLTNVSKRRGRPPGSKITIHRKLDN